MIVRELLDASCSKRLWVLILLWVAAVVLTIVRPAFAQPTLSLLHNFGNGSVLNDGEDPLSALVLGPDGNFYGTTNEGGSEGEGSVFRMTPTGAVTVLHSFDDGSVQNDGVYPEAGLLLGSDGNFYGTTLTGGSAGEGIVFRITASGDLTILHSFGDGSVKNDGMYPITALTLGPDGSFYGTTDFGGSTAASDNGSDGTVFRISLSGTETVLHSFGDGSVAYDGIGADVALILGLDGNFYSTTHYGGTAGDGTAYRITPSGTETVLHSFHDESVANDGLFPEAALALGSDGNFYSTTFEGGAADYGTVYRISPSGSETVLHSFKDGSVANDAVYPVAALFLGPDGNFYGTTNVGGSAYKGTVFRITPSGSETVLHSFGDGTVVNDGRNPFASLIVGTDGDLCGTTSEGGSTVVTDPFGNGYGTVFQLNVGFPEQPVITSISPISGPVGSELTINGTNLAGATTVKFTGGATAVPTSASTTATVMVPTGAETGPITIDTPGGSATTPMALVVTAASTSIAVAPLTGAMGKSVDLTATIATTGNGTAVSDATISFAVNGALTGTAVTDASGVATLPYTINAATGSWTQYYSAAFAGDTAYSESASTAPLTVTEIPTSAALSLSSTSGLPKQAVTMTAFLTTTRGSLPLPNRALSFYAAGICIAVVYTNSAGDASTTYTIGAGDAAGPLTTSVAFDGDTHYLASSSKTTLTVVTLIPTTVTVTPVTGAVGQTHTLTGKLVAGSTPLSNEAVSFSANGATVGTAKTNSSGIATLSYIVTPGIGSWSQYYTVTFVGNADYAKSTESAPLTATSIPAKLSVKITPSTAIAPGKTITVTGTLTSSTGSLDLPGRGLTVYLDGVRIAVATTTSSGAATTTYVIPASEAAGSHTIKVTFTGDAHYAATTGTTTVSVT